MHALTARSLVFSASITLSLVRTSISCWCLLWWTVDWTRVPSLNIKNLYNLLHRISFIYLIVSWRISKWNKLLEAILCADTVTKSNFKILLRNQRTVVDLNRLTCFQLWMIHFDNHRRIHHWSSGIRWNMCLHWSNIRWYHYTDHLRLLDIRWTDY